MKKRNLLIVIILVIFIFVSLGVLYYAFYKNNNQQENEYGNLDSFAVDNTIETTVNNTNTIDDEVNRDILDESNNIVVEDEHKTDNKTTPLSENNKETQTTSQSTKASTQTNANTNAQTKETEKQNSTSATNQSSQEKNAKSSQTSTNQSEKKEDSKTETKIERCTNNSNHAMETGNSGKWFNTEKEAVAYYEALIKEWGDKWSNNKVSDEEYNKNCPYGYEDWDCMYCGKWTINFYYR